jgi:hypothetical protein
MPQVRSHRTICKRTHQRLPNSMVLLPEVETDKRVVVVVISGIKLSSVFEATTY